VLSHWVPLHNGKEAVVFTLVERVTNNYIAIQIPDKNSEAVQTAVQALCDEFGDHFSNVFKTITTVNGSEFENFAQTNSGEKKFTLHIQNSSWDYPVN